MTLESFENWTYLLCLARTRFYLLSLVFEKPLQMACLVPRRLSFDENVRAKEGEKETTGQTSGRSCFQDGGTLPMVPCGSSPVTRFALASAMRKTKRLRRRVANGKEACQDDRVQVRLLSYLLNELLIFS